VFSSLFLFFLLLRLGYSPPYLMSGTRVTKTENLLFVLFFVVVFLFFLFFFLAVLVLGFVAVPGFLELIIYHRSIEY
jgi:hypothetical protein